MPTKNDKVIFGWTKLPNTPKKSPKIAKFLRHEIKHLFHEFYEKSKLLYQIDPSYALEMKRLGFDKPFEILTKSELLSKKGDE